MYNKLYAKYDSLQNLRVELIDEDVVRAHVVPEELLFTLPPKRRPELFPTIQYNYTRGISNLEVKAKVSIKDNGKHTRLSAFFYHCLNLIQGPVVESKTMTGTKKHKRGTVEAKIVKANIPVQNGIVHLIDRPLVIMANSLYEHLCVNSNIQVN